MTAFITGCFITAVAVVTLLRWHPTQVLATVGAQIPQPVPAQPAINLELDAPQQKRLKLSQSFGEVLQDIQTRQGWELDQFALNDLLNIDQNTLGFLRKISADASDPRIVEYAKRMQTQRQTEVNELYSLQKLTGHTHH